MPSKLEKVVDPDDFKIRQKLGSGPRFMVGVHYQGPLRYPLQFWQSRRYIKANKFLAVV